ncbi:MAG: hypothetical protein OEX02_10180 [Cyclobacteriaceae bacterium]|nr:hypothetical protein [Cyclobacteriaceae bacterium]
MIGNIRYVIYFCLTLLSAGGLAQDLANIGKENPLNFSGNVGLSLNTYSTTREAPSRDPFFWTVSGSPTLTVYGITMPFNFVLSQKQQSFRQPFNRFGVSPHYKWLQLHLGYRSMNFSKYSLNGHSFSGVGAEAKPGNFRFGLMHGRLLKAIPYDSLADFPIQPTYKRKGFSAKAGYGTTSNYVDLVLFRGWDDQYSIERPLDSAMVNPQDNLVLAIKSKQRIFKRLSLDVDFGISGWTSNLYARGIPREDIPLPGLTNNLLKVNYSTQVLKAGMASLAYTFRVLSLTAKYERIDPDYKTMGAYYFNTDMENFTISPGWSMLKNKLRVNTSIGIQKNNLFEDKINQTKRRINSFRVNYAPMQKLNVSSSFTNYQTRQIRYDYLKRDVLDSMMLEQYARNFSVGVNYNFGDKVQRYTLSLNNAIQSFAQEGFYSFVGANDSRSISPSLSFRLNNREKKISVNTSINVNDFRNAMTNAFNWGINAGINKKITGDKWSLSGNTGFYRTKLNGEPGGNTIRMRTSVHFIPAEKHTLGLNLNLLLRKSFNTRVKGFMEFMTTVNYNYRF